MTDPMTFTKSVAANIIKGHHLKRNVYLQIMSISLSDLIWKVFATIMNLTNEKNKKLNFFADPTLVTKNCNLRLLLHKITYFYNVNNDDIILWFNCIDKIVHGKNTLFCRCLRLQKQNHVTCVKKSTIVIVHSSLYFFSKYFLSSVPSVKMFSLLTIPIVPTIKSLLLQQGKLLTTTETV